MKISVPRFAAIALAALLWASPTAAVADTVAAGVPLTVEVTPTATTGPTTGPGDPGTVDPTDGPSSGGSPQPTDGPSSDGSSSPSRPGEPDLSRTGTDAATLALWGVAALAAGGAVLRIRHHRSTTTGPARSTAAPISTHQD